VRRHYKPYESDRVHYATLIKCTSGRLCSYCGKRIDYIPSDVEPRYARFCIKCRWLKIPNDIDNPLTGGL
jgi:hypothetical protein